MKKLLMILLLGIFMTGCGETEKIDVGEAEEISMEKNSDKKILVAYFSRADENYSVGNISKGNTKIVAEKIAEKVGGDLFEIQPVKNYPADYTECTEIAKIELKNYSRPEFVGEVKNFSNYDVIFLGYPIWWGDMPMIVYTFLEKNNFSGKKIIPFCTHEGSGLSGTEKNISDTTKAEVLEGLSIRGNVAQNDSKKTDSEIENWLKKLNF